MLRPLGNYVTIAALQETAHSETCVHAVGVMQGPVQAFKIEGMFYPLTPYPRSPSSFALVSCMLVMELSCLHMCHWRDVYIFHHNNAVPMGAKLYPSPSPTSNKSRVLILLVPVISVKKILPLVARSYRELILYGCGRHG